VYDYSPIVWLNEIYEKKYYPSSVEYTFDKMRPTNIDGELYMITKDKLYYPDD